MHVEIEKSFRKTAHVSNATLLLELKVRTKNVHPIIAQIGKRSWKMELVWTVEII